MSLENNDVLDNMYLIRFKMLYTFYDDYFYNKYNGDLSEIIEYLKKEMNLNELFLRRNLRYLTESGYVDDNKEWPGITFKGIKFIEGITDGMFNYEYDQIRMNQIHIINKFQKGDSLE